MLEGVIPVGCLGPWPPQVFLSAVEAPLPKNLRKDCTAKISQPYSEVFSKDENQNFPFKSRMRKSRWEEKISKKKRAARQKRLLKRRIENEKGGKKAYEKALAIMKLRVFSNPRDSMDREYVVQVKLI